MENIAYPLKVARAMSNLTQRQLSQIACVTEVTLSLIENGHVRPKPETKKKIEYGIGIRVDWNGTYDQGRINRSDNPSNGTHNTKNKNKE